MDKIQIKNIIENHLKFLNGEIDSKADLSYVDLSYADLTYVNLSYANLSGTHLRNINLIEANLANIDLTYADLRYADLRYADLTHADLRYADLRYANLTYADLSYVDLNYANLIYADLTNADLNNSKLDNVIINNSTIAFACVCPKEGSFIGWKQAANNYIIKLLIPEDAQRSSATTRKCRASKATVLDIENIDGSSANIKEINSDYDISFIYRIGETVEVKDFDSNRWHECAPGIHFFITREEAVNYQI